MFKKHFPNWELMLLLINCCVGAQLIATPIIIAITLFAIKDLQLFYLVESMLALVMYCLVFGCTALLGD